jgi:hypothetical protein
MNPASLVRQRKLATAPHYPWRWSSGSLAMLAAMRRALLDAFVGVFVMGIAIYHITREFGSMDVDRLTELRG